MPSKSLPSVSQVRTAMALADALSYLHSKRICFRDLKPDNVGFDSMGVLKLFDFGFAVGMDEPPKAAGGVCDSVTQGGREKGLLYEKCGTPRYMAPEVGLEQGYALPADVYSFGILLWEMCALAKPFSKVKSSDEFRRAVFERGARPKLTRAWPSSLKEVITGCWSPVASDRPEMLRVRSALAAHADDLERNPQRQKRSILRRLSLSG